MSNIGIIDLHCDTLMGCVRDDTFSLRENDGHLALDRMKEVGMGAQCYAVYIPTHGSDAACGLEPYEYYQKAKAAYYREMEVNSDLIAPACSAADIISNHEAGLMSGILTVEDSVALFGRIERVDEFFNDGVRLMSLTWNWENSVGFPNSADPELMKLGLKDFGIQTVERMNELGMGVDVSHLSEGGFWDVAKYSKKPFLATHSCARALCDHPRDLTDEQLKAVADHGGIVGINFCAGFLNPGSNYTANADIARHLAHMKKVAGSDILAMGSDFDGIGSTLEMKDCSGYPGLLDEISKVLTADEMDKLISGNALRFFRDVIGD